MRELEVVGVRVQMPDNQPIVLLRERDGDRYLPIWIGPPEASAIAFAQQGVVPPRPLTHDLLKNVLEAFGHELEQVRITEMRDNVYFAELAFVGGAVVESRTSDAIALALRVGCPILGADDVLDEGGIPVPEEDEDEVEKFREFLDQVSAEDFEQPPPPGEAGPQSRSGD
ncbi:bifunctional nuclease family protein [Thalassiella azotivora]